MDVAPLVEAELDRRMPDRAKMRPDDADGFRTAWPILLRLWEQTVARARTLPEEALHRGVDGEWSFVQTLRHLNFASAAWVGRMVLGTPAPWHPLDLPWDEAPGWGGIPWDREARPPLGEVLAVRRDRQAMVGRVIESLTAEHLAATVSRTEPGWPRMEDLPRQRVPPHRPERGMGTPALRRTRPDPPGERASMDILLIAGLWLDGSAWDDVVPALRDLGHRPVPLTLPGQGDGSAAATLDDQVAAVLAAVDAAPGRPLVVGHSAAASLAWIAADARPQKVASVALIGGFPGVDGKPYADFFAVKDGAMPFPGWGPFEGPDSADLHDAARQRIAEAAIPVPEGVATGVVRLTDERRFDVPVVLVCPEFSPAQAQEWIGAGDVPELTRATHLEYVDIDSGHWPMFTRPTELARLLAAAAGDG